MENAEFHTLYTMKKTSIILLVSWMCILFSLFVGAESAVFFFDDFEDGNDDGWTPINGNWIVESGVYSQDIIIGGGNHYMTSFSNFTGEDYNVEIDISPQTSGPYGCSMAFYHDGNTFDPFSPPENYLAITLFPFRSQVSLYTWEKYGAIRSETKATVPLPVGNWHTIKAEVSEGLISVYLNNNLIISNVATALTGGNVLLNTDGIHCHFDNIKVTGSNVLADKDGDGFTSDIDCNDNDASVYPQAGEICDNKDNDCNGEIDEGLNCPTRKCTLNLPVLGINNHTWTESTYVLSLEKRYQFLISVDFSQIPCGKEAQQYLGRFSALI